VVRQLFAGVLVSALLHALAAGATLSYGSYRIDEGATRVDGRSVRLFALGISQRQPLAVSAVSGDFAPILYLVSPDRRVWSSVRGGDDGVSIAIEDAAPGEWYVAVGSADGPSSGEFALTVTPASDPAPVGPALSPGAEAALAALHGRGLTLGMRARGIDASSDGGDPAAAAAAPEAAAEALPALLPWPPPEPSARMLLPTASLADPASLGEADDRLRAALRLAGYDDLGYFAVPDGYAAVTRLERIEETGEPVTDASRWQMTVPASDPSFSLFGYLKALLTAQTGHFRVIAFVVTPAPFTAVPADVDAANARRWAQTGHNALPAALRSQRFTDGHSVTALVYEFSKVRGERSVRFDLPGDLSATTHLKASGILAALQD
jgi:hypothetical protein